MECSDCVGRAVLKDMYQLCRKDSVEGVFRFCRKGSVEVCFPKPFVWEDQW